MEDNERKNDLENNQNNDVNNQGSNDNFGENNTYDDNRSEYNYNGYHQNNSGRYDRGYYSPSNYGNGRNAAAKNSTKLIIVAVSVVAAVLIAAIIGLGIFYNNVLKPLVDDMGSGLGSGQGGAGLFPTGVEILDENFDLTQPTTSGTPYTSLPDAYDATHGVFVEINTTYEETGGVGAGSGFIVAKMSNGKGYYIVTNNHVVEDASKIKIRLTNGDECVASSTVLRDDMTDLAVIAIATDKELPVAKLGKSSDVRVGESIYIIGNPLGTLAGTMTNGIISSKEQEIYIDSHFMGLIQTNAQINPGNSGGPMFNMAGEVVGIVNAKYSGVGIEGIGFAIPIDTAITVVEQMIKQGYVTGRHNLGITTQHNLYGTGGLWISEITSDSALIKAGMPYDPMYCYQIAAINNNSFASSVQANDYIDGLKAGDTVTITVHIYEMEFSSLVYKGTKEYKVTLEQKLATT